MGELEIEKREYAPSNVFAGEFPTLTETGTAGATIEKYTPVMLDESGNIVPVTKEGAAGVIGISAADAEAEEPAVYFMTGEFFADGLNMPSDVTADDIKDALRKLSIFLR